VQKILMTNKEVLDQINFEDACGVNTFLQQIVSCKRKPNCYKLLDNFGNVIDRIVEDEFSHDKYEDRYISPIGEDWWKEDIHQMIADLIGGPADPHMPSPQLVYGLMGYESVMPVSLENFKKWNKGENNG